MIGGFAIGARPIAASRLVTVSIGSIVGTATVAFVIGASAAGTSSVASAASVAIAPITSATGTSRVSATAATAFTITASAVGNVTQGTITYTPSTARQLTGGGGRSLSAPGDRLLFGGGIRSLTAE